ncbi:MAG: siderophore-interacting protein [Aeromicrobium sp.]|nr:MAG: siderophore-interacting protein [Aeromicrobium sp.]
MARTRREVLHWPAVIRELTVAEVIDVTPTLRRIILTGDELREFAVEGGTAAPYQSEGFDDSVKVLVPFANDERPPLPVQGPDRLEWGAAGGRPIAKDYTPREFTGDSLALEFVRHGHGFASGWVEHVQTGSLTWIVGPTRSSLWPTNINAAMMFADETALPAIARLLAQWPSDREVPTTIIVDVPSEASILDMPIPDGVAVKWVHGREAWVAASRDVPWPMGDVFTWIAGEAGAVRAIRQFVTSERGVPRDLLDATGYWRA